jgi:ABC-type Fe3+-hydroxamate transport system substrate-binding protein
VINFLNKDILDAAIANGETLRIVSAVPSLTEYLYSLGLEEEVLGITKFCVHPKKWFQTKQRVGGTKNISIEKTLALQPHVIIASKEENIEVQMLALAEHCTVILTNISTVENSFEQLTALANALKKQVEGQKIVQAIQQKIKEYTNTKKGTALYCIWKDPYLFAGKDTYIHSMMQVCGYSNIVETNRYPEINMGDIQKLAPQHLLLSSEPYPFAQKHIDELKHLLPNTNIELVDGELYSWYGSRIIKL